MMTLSRLLRPLLAFSLLLLAPATQASETIRVSSGPHQTAVIELYTSEGCSSCPPADQWLEQLVQLPADELDVLALAFHVDYWDYIGWKDRFASPAYSNRQRHLARINRQDSAYTPEFFVNGAETRGTRRIIQQIQQINKQPARVHLELAVTRENDQLKLSLNSQYDQTHSPRVRFVVFEDKLSSNVKNGENAGMLLKHQRVVRHFSQSQSLQPTLSHQLSLDPQWKQKHLGVGALVSTPDGEYLQAVYSLLAR